MPKSKNTCICSPIGPGTFPLNDPDGAKAREILEESLRVKTRTLQSGRVVDEQQQELRMSISSKCPDKWLFVDLETGDVWHHREGYKEGEHPFWRGATAQEKRELRKLRIRA